MRRSFLLALVVALGVGPALGQAMNSTGTGAPATPVESVSAPVRELWHQELVIPGGPDLGQRLGTLLEIRSGRGDLLVSAGFVNGGQSLGLNDHRSLSIYVHPGRIAASDMPKPDALPGRPFSASSLFSVATHRGELLAYRIGVAGPVMRWDSSARTWIEHELTAGERPRVVNVIQVVENELLVIYKDGVSFRGVDLDLSGLGDQAGTSFASGLYFNGRLVLSAFRSTSPNGNQAPLFDCRWNPRMTALSDCQEARFDDRGRGNTGDYVAYGMHGLADGQILVYGLAGYIHVYRDGVLRGLVDIEANRSWQAYSTIERYGRLLIGQYPSGNLMELSLREHLSSIDRREAWSEKEAIDTLMVPPVAAPSEVLRDEAQSLMLLGDDVYVGMWPWAEIYRGVNGGRWERIVDSLTGTEPTADKRHPAERKAGSNCLGMRVYQILPWSGGLVFQTTVKNEISSCKASFRRMDPTDLEPYGRVYYMDVPGSLSCPLHWHERPTQVRIALTSNNRLVVHQDGRAICGRQINVAHVVAMLQRRDIRTWVMPAVGLYGRRTSKVNEVR